MTLLRRLGTAVAVAAAVSAAGLVVAAPPASAHTVTGIAPTDYRSQVAGVVPALPGVNVRLLDLGRRIRLTNTGPEVVILGYQGEPFLRVGPGGVFENVRSPTVYVNKVTTANTNTTSTTLPKQADASAPPSWRRTGGGNTVTWRDHRTRWEGPAPPAVKADPGSAHVVSQWLIGLRRGEQESQITGRITYVPGPSALPWIALAVVVFALTAAAAFLRRWGPVLSVALAVLIAVDVVHSFGIAAVTHDAFVVQAGRVLFGGIVATIGWIVGAVAVGPLQDQREGGVVGAGLAGFVLGVFSGIGDVSSLMRSQVPFTFSAPAGRVAVALTIGLGLGLVAAALVVLRRGRGVKPSEPAEST